MKKGFTLIELLIVVAIIAILAAIAVPNFLEAQVRSKVSRAKADMRSYSTGIESYYVDNNIYPVAARGTTVYPTGQPADPSGQGNINRYLVSPQAAATSALGNLSSFGARNNANPGLFAVLTTPISYITSYFPDPFADQKGSTFAYYADTNGWIVWTCGPDGDQGQTTDLGAVSGSGPAVDTVYQSTIAQPSPTLNAGSRASGEAYTYDPTNGTVSPGDVWRVKQ
jgi:prepilin-type N-terminal cleavage/methylation domain-containing protein